MRRKKRLQFLLIFIVLLKTGTLWAEGTPLYLNPSVPVERRVADLLHRMTLAEKIGQMTQLELGMFVEDQRNRELSQGKIDLYIGHYGIGSVLSGGGSAPKENNASEWVKTINRLQKAAAQTRLGIPILYGIDAVHGHNNVIGAVIYPHNLGLAATWNTDLAEKIGEMTARDVRATAVNWTFAPVLDVARDIRWGRIYETFGEDPYLVSRMGEAVVRGLQKDNLIIACAKHYMGYSGAYNGKDRNPTDVSERTLREVFLPPFAAAVKAGVGSIMVNSGEVNGIPVHASYDLLTAILRKELKFGGFSVTDWDDIRKLYSYHKTAETYKEAIYQAIMAGIDMGMVPFDAGYCDLLIDLVEEGRIPLKRINEAVRRILTVKFKLGLFENRYIDEEATKVIGDRASRNLALQAARQSITLLQNNNNILPLSKEIKNIMLTGPAADGLSMLCGGWTIGWQGASERDLAKMGPTLMAALRAKLPMETNLNYIRSFSLKNQIYLEKLKEACAAADVCIVALGEKPYAEGGGDANNVKLPADQVELVKLIASYGKPIVVVLVSGRPLILTDIIDSTAAIIWAYLPGTAGGEAIADVLTGAYNPSGKLPITIPRDQGQLPLWYNCKSTVDYKPLFSFGYGLSYTKFTYSNLKKKSEYQPTEDIVLSIDVKNAGPVAGDEVVILYIGDLFRTVTPARKEVKGFTRISLEPGQEKTVTFKITREDLKFYNAKMQKVFEPGEFYVEIGDEQGIIMVK